MKHRDLVGHRIDATVADGQIEVAQCLHGFSHNGRRIRRASVSDLRVRTYKLQKAAHVVLSELATLLP
jgi:hypothetical protein